MTITPESNEELEACLILAIQDGVVRRLQKPDGVYWERILTGEAADKVLERWVEAFPHLLVEHGVVLPPGVDQKKFAMTMLMDLISGPNYSPMGMVGKVYRTLYRAAMREAKNATTH